MSQASLTTLSSQQRESIMPCRATKGMKEEMLGDCTSRSTELNRVNTRTSRSPPASSMSAKERAIVDHTYHDHLHDPEESESSFSSGESDQRPRKKGPRGGVTVTFPEKLHIMLHACEEEGLNNVVSWLPHGRCVVVSGGLLCLEAAHLHIFFQPKDASSSVRRKTSWKTSCLGKLAATFRPPRI
jgi:hypothetical protein